MADSKFIKANEKIAENVTTGFNKMSDSVVSGFNKITEGVVKGYTAIEDKFVGQFLTKEGETVEEAKKRLAQNAANPQGVYRTTTDDSVAHSDGEASAVEGKLE